MEYNPLLDSILGAAALAGTILFLGAAFLLVLRTSKVQYSLRFLLLSVGCIAAVIGLWTALLRNSRGSGLTGPGSDTDTMSPSVESPSVESLEGHPPGQAGPESDAHVETLQYLRHSGDGFVREMSIQFVEKQDLTQVIHSHTDRTSEQLDLIARFQPTGQLIDAIVTTTRGGERQSAKATRELETVHVTRTDGSHQDLDCPADVIVTSAPDWTDAVLLVKRYDRKERGRQEFAGLWIHPTQQSLRLQFSIEQVGEDMVQHDGAEVTLERFLIVLRGGSRYIGWGNGRGELVRLMSEGRPTSGIVLATWESSAWSIALP